MKDETFILHVGADGWHLRKGDYENIVGGG